MALTNDIKTFFKYNWLLELLVERDLKVKYRRSVLGYFWSILNPLLMMIILTIVFSTVFRFDIPNYPVYLLAGQLIYSFFAEATSMALSSILDGAALIKKVYLPKYIFPLSRVLSSFASVVLSLCALFLVMLITDVEFHVTIILLPLAMMYILLFSIGIGLIMSAGVVFFRDLKYLYTVFLTALNYITPIFYPANIVPAEYKMLVEYNPLYFFVSFFREVTIYGQWPNFELHLWCLMYSCLAMGIGVYCFKRYQGKFILYI